MTNDASKDLDRFLVDSVSYEVSRVFRTVPLVDIREDLWRWYDAHPRLLETLRADEQGYERQVRRRLKQAALWYCHHRRAEQHGYMVDDLAFYSTGLIRELLPAAVSGEVVAPARDSTSGRGTQAPSEGGNLEVTLIDIRRAFQDLSEGERLRLRLHLGGYEEMGGRELERLLRKMQAFLGGPAPVKDPGDLGDDTEMEIDPAHIVRLLRQGKVDLEL